MLPLAVLAVGGAVFLGGSSVAYAHAKVNDTLTKKIATRFNLDEGDVDRVFDEIHEDKQAEHEARLSEYLQKKVDEGVITEEQRTLLEEKRAEVFEAIRNIHEQDLSSEEKFGQIKQVHEDLKTWAKDNDIPIETLRPANFKARGKFHGGGHR